MSIYNEIFNPTIDLHCHFIYSQKSLHPELNDLCFGTYLFSFHLNSKKKNKKIRHFFAIQTTAFFFLRRRATVCSLYFSSAVLLLHIHCFINFHYQHAVMVLMEADGFIVYVYFKMLICIFNYFG